MDSRSPIQRLAAAPNAAEAAETARQAVDRVRGHKVLRSQSARVTAESQLRGARASAALGSLSEPGTDWPLEEVRRRTDLGDEDGSGHLRGALRISGELGALVPGLEAFPDPGPVAHAPARRRRAPGSRPDRAAPRSGSRGHADHPGERAARPGPPTCRPWWSRRRCTPNCCAEPFGWGDGLLACAASRLILADRGLDPQSLAVVEAGHVDLGVEAYLEAARGYATGTEEGLAAWLEHYAEAVVLGARESLAVCEAIMRG